MSSLLNQLLEEGRKQEEERLQAVGVDQSYKDWQESMSTEGIPDEVAMDTFLHLTDLESQAQQGQLQVINSGKPIEDIGTTPPGRGPDDEETRPDEAGDGGDEGVEAQAPEGMWMPPRESEIEGYEPPTTAQVKKSPEFIRNARIVRKGIGGDPDQFTDEEIGDWAANQMSLFNWNLIATVAYAKKITTADDPELALAFLNMMNMYDHSDGGYREFGNALTGLMTDPTTYFGVGVGAAAAKGAARVTAKTGLKRIVTGAIVGGTAGLTEGSLLAGGFDLAKQNIEQEAGAREDLDYARAGLSAAAGGGLGLLLGGGGGALAGRNLDKFLDQLDKEITRNLGGKKRDVADFDEPRLREALEAAKRTAEDSGIEDPLTDMYLKGIDDPKAPRDEEGVLDVPAFLKDMDTQWNYNQSLAGKLEKDADNTFNFRHGEDFDPDTMDGAKISEEIISDLEATAQKAGIEDYSIDTWSDGAQDVTSIRFSDEKDAEKFLKAAGPKKTVKIGGQEIDEVPMSESEALQQRLIEVDELQRGDVVLRSPTHRGSTIRSHKDFGLYELTARTKNGWYKAINKRTGEEANFRRKQFDVVDKLPAPKEAGPMSLDPFGEDAATIIKMAEDVTNRKLTDHKIPHSVHAKLIADMKDLGVNILEKEQRSHWTATELKWLRDVYDSQARGMAELTRRLDVKKRNEGGLTDADLAFFNTAHAQFMATRDLFYGVSGNAARQLNILRSRPTKDVYDFADAVQNDLGIGGGRVNTERAIENFMTAIRIGEGNAGQKVAKANNSIWDNRKTAWLLQVRYNMMLSSWRTHAFNAMGNTVSGLYHYLLVNPIGGTINNLSYASKLAYSKIPGTKVDLDPASRWTFKVYGKELQAHFYSAMDSLRLAKEIALGRDIGEGKIWNELGLRYDVVNVPQSKAGQLGSAPVRMLEAGDAFFKNQYFNSHMYGIAAHKARRANIEEGVDFETAFQQALDNATPQDMQAAKEFAAKQTYTNDPNVYENIFGILADGLNKIQSRDKSMTMNMLMPFIRTPANLLSYSVDMTGLNAVVPGFGMNRTYRNILGNDPVKRQEALAKLTAAVGLWYTVYQLHQEGRISGTGPVNWEEIEAWKAAGWQPNSIKIGDNWYDMSRAAPGGTALTTIASILDYMNLNHDAKEEDAIGFVGASLLYLADNMIDESFMSTTADTITAIQAKNLGRQQSVIASTINSVLVPNLVRDLRKVTDPTVRSTTSDELGNQIVHQMKNAWPGFSDELPPRRDWKGDPLNYYGNAYQRGLIPFAVRDSQDTDPASMAIAYSRIGPSKPDKKITMPGGRGNAIDLFAMDNGRGHVYDKYLELVGKARHKAVTKAMNKRAWHMAVAEGRIGPGSQGEAILRKALAIGTAMGRVEMLSWLQQHSGENNTFKRANGDEILINHQFNQREYRQFVKAARKQNIPVPDDRPQYVIERQEEGPEFFKQ